MSDAEKNTSTSLFSKATAFLSRFIDLRIGLAGGLVMGCIVFFINYSDTHDLSGALTASLKQGVYTFLFGGFIMKGCKLLATKVNPRWLALTAAVIIPSMVAIGLTYAVHSTKGTPKPLESTIPTVFFVIPSTAVWGYRQRQKQSLKEAPAIQ